MPKLYGVSSAQRKPEWLKIRLPRGKSFSETDEIVRKHNLHTICSSGKCPNKAECWSHHTATFMILGDICTRGCRFCATKTGTPFEADMNEPQRVAESVRLMSLRHVIVTSVTRDDLEDGGATIWAETVKQIRTKNPSTTIELLIPDLDAEPKNLDTVLSSGPDIIGHNIETVRRLTPVVRAKATYSTSMSTLKYLSEHGAITKSGIMVGLGENDEEVVATLGDLREVGVRIVTIGQYLRPTEEQIPVVEYITPEKFEWYRQQAMEMGFQYCASGPLVRSSYLAEQALPYIR